jgi:cystathionine beta-lyase/cystathionine gamma-synthase
MIFDHPKMCRIRPERFIASSEDHRMLRLYCGLEDADYIINDLERGFRAIKEME